MPGGATTRRTRQLSGNLGVGSASGAVDAGASTVVCAAGSDPQLKLGQLAAAGVASGRRRSLAALDNFNERDEVASEPGDVDERDRVVVERRRDALRGGGVGGGDAALHLDRARARVDEQDFGRRPRSRRAPWRRGRRARGARFVVELAHELLVQRDREEHLERGRGALAGLRWLLVRLLLRRRGGPGARRPDERHRFSARPPASGCGLASRTARAGGVVLVRLGRRKPRRIRRRARREPPGAGGTMNCMRMPGAVPGGKTRSITRPVGMRVTLTCIRASAPSGRHDLDFARLGGFDISAERTRRLVAEVERRRDDGQRRRGTQ